MIKKYNLGTSDGRRAWEIGTRSRRFLNTRVHITLLYTSLYIIIILRSYYYIYLYHHNIIPIRVCTLFARVRVFDVLLILQ